jgi:glycosyltransferase involved in cell wall biosynthesis
MRGPEISFAATHQGSAGEVPRKLGRVVWHVTQFLWPPMGGQEYLIMQMCQAVAERGSRSVVLQPLTLRLLMPSTYRGRPWPPRTLLLPIPTLAPLITLLQRLSCNLPGKFRLTSQWASDFGWRAFNWSLRVFHPLLRWWCRSGTVVVHYHLHQPHFSSTSTVVFSHGVEWRRPPITALDRLRAGSLSAVMRDPKVVLVLANDRDYIDEAVRVSGASLVTQKLHLLANPVDTARFRPNGSTASQQYSHRRLVMIRNVRRDRGILEGVEAFLLFRAIGGHSEWQLDVYGAFSSDDEYFRRCAAAAADAGSAVRFHGNVPNDLVPGILSRSSIALVPSQELEGTSLAALEAMASGVPCVSTPIGGLRDIPTYKSTSVEPIDIAQALMRVSANYENIRSEQTLETQRHFSLTAWKSSFCAAIADVESRHA